MATRADVAALAGVSPAVVSYVLNRGPRPVSPSTRDRVERAVADLGYRPNHAARSLRMRRTGTLGLLVPDNINPYFAELAKAVEDEAFGRGYTILLGNSSYDHSRENAYLSTFLDRQVDGLLVGAVWGGPRLAAVVASGTPIVGLERPPRGARFPSVAVDTGAAAAAGTRHLIAHGHRRIGAIFGPAHLRGSRECRAGWRAALRDAELAAPDDHTINAPLSRRGGFDAAMALLRADPPPTALFAGSDVHAVAALHAVRACGRNVPADIAVVSLDGTKDAGYAQPPLTVIRRPIEQLARAGIDRLLRADPMNIEHVVISFELIVGQSCGCAGTDATEMDDIAR